MLHLICIITYKKRWAHIKQNYKKCLGDNCIVVYQNLVRATFELLCRTGNHFK